MTNYFPTIYKQETGRSAFDNPEDALFSPEYTIWLEKKLMTVVQHLQIKTSELSVQCTSMQDFLLDQYIPKQ